MVELSSSRSASASARLLSGILIVAICLIAASGDAIVNLPLLPDGQLCVYFGLFAGIVVGVSGRKEKLTRPLSGRAILMALLLVAAFMLPGTDGARAGVISWVLLPVVMQNFRKWTSLKAFTLCGVAIVLAQVPVAVSQVGLVTRPWAAWVADEQATDTLSANRFMGTFVHPGLLGCAMFVAMLLLLRGRRAVSAPLFATVFFLATVFLVASGSRTFMLAAACFITLEYLAKRNGGESSPWHFLGAVLLSSALIYSPLAALLGRSTWNQRVEIFSRAYELALQRNPLIGIGWQQTGRYLFTAADGSIKHAHNVVLQIFLELGLIGVGALALVFRDLWKKWDGRAHRLAVSLFIAVSIDVGVLLADRTLVLILVLFISLSFNVEKDRMGAK